MPRWDQLFRQWQLLQFIDRPNGITVDDAAREPRCAVWTIWRDLHVLHAAGFPIDDARASDGRPGLWKGFTAGVPLKLPLAELASLLMSRELLAPLGASVLGDAVASADDRIASVLSRYANALLDRMRETVGVWTPGAKLQRPRAEHAARIQQGLLERRRLGLVYHSCCAHDGVPDVSS